MTLNLNLGKLSNMLDSASANTTTVRDLSIDDVVPDPAQVRKDRNQGFTESSLNELASSINATGITNPLIVREDPENSGKYIIICGERRFRAAKMIGLKSVPALVRRFDNQEEILSIQITENLQRVDLDLEEVSNGVLGLLDLGLSQREIARRLGKSAPEINCLASARKWPDFLWTYFRAGKIGSSLRTIYEIYQCSRIDEDKTKKFVDDLISTKGSVARSDIKYLRSYLGQPVEEESGEASAASTLNTDLQIESQNSVEQQAQTALSDPSDPSDAESGSQTEEPCIISTENVGSEPEEDEAEDEETDVKESEANVKDSEAVAAEETFSNDSVVTTPAATDRSSYIDEVDKKDDDDSEVATVADDSPEEETFEGRMTPEELYRQLNEFKALAVTRKKGVWTIKILN